MDQSTQPMPGYPAQAYEAGDIRVFSGANLGDAIGGPEDCQPGDIYRVAASARAARLMLCPAAAAKGQQLIAPGSDIGAAGDLLIGQSVLTLLASDGERLVIVIVKHQATNRVYALPLSPMTPLVEYTLVDLSDDLRDIRLTDIICVSFAAGTLITLPGGRQQLIERLEVGDTVLTRDNGPQPIRWLGKATLRAKGSFAPVVISAGTLGNSSDLIVSPHHRIFLYQRGARRLGGTAEILVQAKHLVDGSNVWQREGGFVDYYSLVFDHHEIIFAEGIPAESLMVNQETVRLLPPELAQELTGRFPGLRQSQHFGTEATRAALDAAGRDSLFRAKET
ncbi:MAG: Hint domain-containing protein [Albidovulum sp.]|jgi:hypothetical protein